MRISDWSSDVLFRSRDMIQSLLAARALTIDTVQAAPHSTVVFPEQPRDILFERCLQHADHKIDCFPASFRQAQLFERCEALFDEMSTAERRVGKECVRTCRSRGTPVHEQKNNT